MQNNYEPIMQSNVSDKYSISTNIKKNLFKSFNHIIENPPIEEIIEFYKKDKTTFKFNNKNFNAYINIPDDNNYFHNFYKTFGHPHVYGLYHLDKIAGTDILIGLCSMILRYDNKVWQIMDILIDKNYRSKGGLDKFISYTLPTRIMKSSAYYGICMCSNLQIEKITQKIKLPKMKSRGKMLIYLVEHTKMREILPALQTFYCSDIGFVDNFNLRVIADNKTNRAHKILHVHHNAQYREYTYDEVLRGYQYCFSIHESNEFIIESLEQEFKIKPCASAIVYSNDFKTDWSKFVKTFEI